MLRNKFLISVAVLAVGQGVLAGEKNLDSYRPGVYVGGQVGYGTITEGDGPEKYLKRFSGFKVDKKKFGGRVFIGYSFLPYLGFEIGNTYYPGNYYRSDYAWLRVGVRTIDLLAKGTFQLKKLSPHFDGWSVFGKLGVAMLTTNSKVNGNGESELQFRPAYGLGVAYNFTDNFGFDLSWMGMYSKDKMTYEDINRCFSAGSSVNKVPSANLMAFGIFYKF